MKNIWNLVLLFLNFNETSRDEKINITQVDYEPNDNPTNQNCKKQESKSIILIKSVTFKPNNCMNPLDTFQSQDFAAIAEAKGRADTGSDGDCKRELESLEAEYKLIVLTLIEQYEKDVCELEVKSAQVGTYDEEKARLEILINYHNKELEKWQNQLSLSGTDPESRFFGVYKRYDAGYKRGLTTRNNRFTFGRENGLRSLIPN